MSATECLSPTHPVAQGTVQGTVDGPSCQRIDPTPHPLWRKKAQAPAKPQAQFAACATAQEAIYSAFAALPLKVQQEVVQRLHAGHPDAFEPVRGSTPSSAIPGSCPTKETSLGSAVTTVADATSQVAREDTATSPSASESKTADKTADKAADKAWLHPTPYVTHAPGIGQSSTGQDSTLTASTARPSPTSVEFGTTVSTTTSTSKNRKIPTKRFNIPASYHVPFDIETLLASSLPPIDLVKRTSTTRIKALVLGNSKHTYLDDLASSPVDVRLIETGLKAQGCEDIAVFQDLDTKTMKLKFKQFYKGLTKDDFVFVYFTGHGMDTDGDQLLLLGTDHDPSQPAQRSELSANFIGNKLAWASAGALIFADCCRLSNTSDYKYQLRRPLVMALSDAKSGFCELPSVGATTRDFACTGASPVALVSACQPGTLAHSVTLGMNVSLMTAALVRAWVHLDTIGGTVSPGKMFAWVTEIAAHLAGSTPEQALQGQRCHSEGSNAVLGGLAGFEFRGVPAAVLQAGAGSA